MENLKNLLNILKNNKNEIQIIKIMVIIAINTWLLIIFWKALLIDNVFMGNNIALTKMNTVIQPVLQILGLEILSPNTIKMMLISMIVITANLMVIHFQKMIMVMITAIMARYGYKSYTNYLINNENMMQIGSQMPTQASQITQKVVEQAPIVINTGANSGTNWWLWGTVIVVGAIAIGGIAFMVWSHNTNANNMANLADQTASLTTNVRTQINNIDQKATHINTQVDLLFTNHGKALDSLENTNKLLNEKITNLDKGFKDFGSQISKLEANNIENIQILAKNTLNISEESQKFFTNVLETESASDALVVIITKMMDGFNILENDLKTVETRVDSITGQVTTPRGSAFFTRMPSTRINTTNINQNE
jgi:hypothetical protein